MKNRTEEYWALVQELSQPPQKLEGTVRRARRRAKRAKLARRFAAPIASLASAAACFVLLVNLSPAFALACSNVPIVRELTAAVAFSPSLSAAVAHDYVQYIGQSQTVDGVTVKLEYAIVDRHEAVFFYSVDGARFYTSPDLTDMSGTAIGGYALSTYHGGQGGDEDQLAHMDLSFLEGNGLPERFTMEMYFMPESKPGPDTYPEASAIAPSDEFLDSDDPDAWSDPREDPGVLRFTFDVTLDPSRIVDPIVAPVNRWVELDGQRILVDRLEYTPTRTVLYLGEDEANSAWLESLKFWFEDEKGVCYDNIDGSVSASGNNDSQSYLTYYFRSFYYDQPRGLTLCIDKAQWLDKDAPHVFVDLTAGTATNLPDGVRIGEITRKGNNVQVEVLSPLSRKHFSQSFSSTYWDPAGGEHSWNQMSYTSVYNDDNEEIACKETFYLSGYTWDSVELELLYTDVSLYEPTVRVPLS